MREILKQKISSLRIKLGIKMSEIVEEPIAVKRNSTASDANDEVLAKISKKEEMVNNEMNQKSRNFAMFLF